MRDTYSLEYSRRYFNRYGALLRVPNWIDGPVYGKLIATAGLDLADSVIEIGAGRGPLAAQFVALGRIPRRVVLTEASDRLYALLLTRFSRHRDRIDVRFVQDAPPLPLASGSFERFVSCFVLDTMDLGSRAEYVSEAHRLLADGALFCALTVTDGPSPLSRVVMKCGRVLSRRSPWLALGARYESVIPMLMDGRWKIEVREAVVRMGCASEMVVARKLPDDPPA